jgi:hypothetical protein
MLKWNWLEWLLFLAALLGLSYGSWLAWTANPPHDYLQAAIGWWLIFVGCFLMALLFTPTKEESK